MLAAACLALAAGRAWTAETPPAPSDAEAFENLFAKDLRAVRLTRDPKDDVDLAGRMVAAARAAGAGPEFIALATATAYDLAAALPDGGAVAEAAMRLLAEKVPAQRAAAQDRLVALCQAAYARARGPARAEAGERLIEALLEAARLQTEALDLAAATGTYRHAIGVASAIQWPDRAALQAALQEAGVAQRRLAEAARLAGVLRDDPADQAARQEVLRIYLVDLDRPDRAAAYLDPADESIEAKLVLLAAMSVKRLPEAACLRLAEWYQDLSEKAAGSARETMLVRARTYAEAFLAKHAAEDAPRAKVQAMIEAIEEKLARLAPRQPLSAGAVCILTFDPGTFFRSEGRLYTRDRSGSGNHAAVTGAKPGPGKVGTALVFDGRGDGLDLGNAPSLQITGSQTIALWVKPSRLGCRQNPYAKAYGGEGTWTLEPDGRVNYYYGTAGGNSSPYTHVTMPGPVPIGAWTHLVLVRDYEKRQVVWYMNGKPVAEAKASGKAASASSLRATLGIGYAGAYGGSLDEFALFARALSAHEVRLLYGMGLRGASLAGR
jgi:hypothetical protein